MAVPFSNTWCLPNSLRFKLNQAKEPNIQPNISPAPHSAIVRHSCRGSTIEFPRLNCSENSSMRSWVSFSSSHTSCPWSGIHGFLGRYQKLPETMVVLLIKYIYIWLVNLCPIIFRTQVPRVIGFIIHERFKLEGGPLISMVSGRILRLVRFL